MYVYGQEVQRSRCGDLVVGQVNDHVQPKVQSPVFLRPLLLNSSQISSSPHPKSISIFPVGSRREMEKMCDLGESRQQLPGIAGPARRAFRLSPMGHPVLPGLRDSDEVGSGIKFCYQCHQPNSAE